MPASNCAKTAGGVGLNFRPRPSSIDVRLPHIQTALSLVSVCGVRMPRHPSSLRIDQEIRRNMAVLARAGVRAVNATTRCRGFAPILPNTIACTIDGCAPRRRISLRLSGKRLRVIHTTAEQLGFDGTLDCSRGFLREIAAQTRRARRPYIFVMTPFQSATSAAYLCR